MAPFTIYPRHPLSYQCHLRGTAPYMQSIMTSELSSKTPGTHKDLPLSPYCRVSIFSMLLKIRLHLWQVVQRVLKCCMSVTELFSSKMFFFICVGKNAAMTGELKNGVEEAQERPGWDFMSGAMGSVNVDKEMKVIMEVDVEELTKPAEKQEWSVNSSDEEEGDEARLSEWESEEETDDGSDEEEEEEDDDDDEDKDGHDCDTECDENEDSEWSDDEDDEGDSEASAESLELWESFLNSSDPYNPLSFSSSTGSKTNTTNKLTLSSQIKGAEATPAPKAEEHNPKPSTKEGGKKVCFSDKVTVHPLVAWSFASRAARSGSCWLQMARDRERFRRRVENIEKDINYCLTPEHRASVWERLQTETLS